MTVVYKKYINKVIVNCIFKQNKIYSEKSIKVEKGINTSGREKL